MTQKSYTSQEFARLCNNFYNSKNIAVDASRFGTDAELFNYVNSQQELKKHKVAFVWICLNPPYWQYAQNMIQGARQFFLPGHDVDYFLFSDIPKDTQGIKGVIDGLQKQQADYPYEQGITELTKLSEFLHANSTVFPTEAVQWPMPTLMRYHLFLQQEEKLKEYDYIAYCDCDMAFVNVVGDEVLGDGLTAAVHPGYFVDKKFIPPYEGNKDSTAYIPRPGRVVEENGKPRFMPLYYAGGFQLGKSEEFIKAMKVMKKNIDKDFTNNFIAIWNDESHWNRYLFDNPPSVVLTPSYIYPDSLIEEYYNKIWGCAYQPKLVTLTKKFTTTAEGGAEAAKMIQQLK